MTRVTLAVLQTAVIVLILLTCVVYGVAYIARWLDDTAYHIPTAVRIAHHLNPYFVASPVDSHWFPAGAETFVALLVLATGSLYATNLSGCLCVIALAVLMYRFAGVWSRDPLPRLATVGSVCTIPLIIGQSLAFYVDIHLALLVCLAIYFECVSLARRDAQPAYYGLAAATLAPSIKYSGLQFFLILGPAGLFCLLCARTRRRPGAKAIALISLCVLFTSGWYLRNWLSRGNPIFPFAVPAWAQPLLSLAPAPYEFSSIFVNVSPKSTLPHPWVPRSWLAYDYKPDMTDDAFGASAVLAGLCALVALALCRRLSVDMRRAWIFVVTVGGFLIATFPLSADPVGLQVPRYFLFAPILLCLGPAVLARAAAGVSARRLVEVLCAAILAVTATCAYVNLLAPGSEWTKLRVAASYLWPYRPHGLRQMAYAQRGHLRIGYTSGVGNTIALLYDSRLTNTLIPLHYRNYHDHWKEFDSPDEFIAYVRSLDLDYIHVFDPRYPGVALLRQHFPEKIMPK